jgi:hypothetical protein
MFLVFKYYSITYKNRGLNTMTAPPWLDAAFMALEYRLFDINDGYQSV